MRTSLHVHNFLQSEDVQHELFTMDGQAKTAKRTAAILGLKPGTVAKNLLFIADGGPLMIIVPGDRRADVGKIKKAVDAVEVEFAIATDVSKLTDYPLAATPPCAHKDTIPVVIDKRLLDNEVIYTSAGDPHMILKIRPKDLVKATCARIAAVSV